MSGPTLLRIGGGGVIVNGRAVEVPPPDPGLNTVTCTTPVARMSAAEICAVNCTALINVVGRGLPFHRIWEPDIKLLPFAVRVNPDPPAEALEGTKLVRVGGGTIVNAMAAEGS